MSEIVLPDYNALTSVSAWEMIGVFVQENYSRGRAVFIPKLGTFTYTFDSVDLDGSTNPETRRIEDRAPVFLVSQNLAPGVETGIFAGGRLRPFSNKGLNGRYPTTRINYAKIGNRFKLPIDTVKTVINRAIRQLRDEIVAGKRAEREIPRVGRLLSRGSVFGVLFQTQLSYTRQVVSRSHSIDSDSIYLTRGANRWLRNRFSLELDVESVSSEAARVVELRGIVRKEPGAKYLADSIGRLQLILNSKDLLRKGRLDYDEFVQAVTSIKKGFVSKEVIDDMIGASECLQGTKVDYVKFVNALDRLRRPQAFKKERTNEHLKSVADQIWQKRLQIVEAMQGRGLTGRLELQISELLSILKQAGVEIGYQQVKEIAGVDKFSLLSLINAAKAILWPNSLIPDFQEPGIQQEAPSLENVSLKLRRWIKSQSLDPAAAFSQLLQAAQAESVLTEQKLSRALSTLALSDSQIQFLYKQLDKAQKGYVSSEDWQSFIYDNLIASPPLRYLITSRKLTPTQFANILPGKYTFDLNTLAQALQQLEPRLTIEASRFIADKYMGNRNTVDIGTLLSEVFLQHELPADMRQLIHKSQITSQPGPDSLREKLYSVDPNRVGIISVQQFIKALEGIDMDHKEIAELANSLANSQKQIDYITFLRDLVDPNILESTLKRLQLYFYQTTEPLDMFFKWYDGMVKVEVFAQFLKAKVNRQADYSSLLNVARQLDRDKDGVIVLEDMRSLVGGTDYQRKEEVQAKQENATKSEEKQVENFKERENEILDVEEPNEFKAIQQKPDIQPTSNLTPITREKLKENIYNKFDSPENAFSFFQSFGKNQSINEQAFAQGMKQISQASQQDIQNLWKDMTFGQQSLGQTQFIGSFEPDKFIGGIEKRPATAPHDQTGEVAYKPKAKTLQPKPSQKTETQQISQTLRLTKSEYIERLSATPQNVQHFLDNLNSQLHAYMLSPRDAFKRFTVLSDGKISYAVFYKILQTLNYLSGFALPSDSIIQKAFEIINVQGQGEIDLREWISCFKHIPTLCWNNSPQYYNIVRQILKHKRILMMIFESIAFKDRVSYKQAKESIAGTLKLILPEHNWRVLLAPAENSGVVDFRALFDYYKGLKLQICQYFWSNYLKVALELRDYAIYIDVSN